MRESSELYYTEIIKEFSSLNQITDTSSEIIFI